MFKAVTYILFIQFTLASSPLPRKRTIPLSLSLNPKTNTAYFQATWDGAKKNLEKSLLGSTFPPAEKCNN